MAKIMGTIRYINANGKTLKIDLPFDDDNIFVQTEDNETLDLFIKKAEPEPVNQLIGVVEKIKNIPDLDIKIRMMFDDELNEILSMILVPTKSFQFAGTKITYSHGFWVTPDHKEIPFADKENAKPTMRDALAGVINYRLNKLYEN